MDIRAIATHPEHFNLIDFRNQEAEALANDPSAKQRFFSLCEIGQTGTLLCDGRILCIMGLCQLWPGVWECFVFPSRYIHDYKKVYLRYAKTYLHQSIEDYKIRRIQTMSLSDPETNKWMQFLGFNFEGLHRKYGPEGSDYCAWSIVI